VDVLRCKHEWLMGIAAVKYLEASLPAEPLDEAAFDKACGVGKLYRLLWLFEADCPGIDISVAQLPELLKSYIAVLPTPPKDWVSLGPITGGIKSSTSDLK
jgi:glutaminyl-tRNA synthetase